MRVPPLFTATAFGRSLTFGLDADIAPRVLVVIRHLRCLRTPLPVLTLVTLATAPTCLPPSLPLPGSLAAFRLYTVLRALWFQHWQHFPWLVARRTTVHCRIHCYHFRLSVWHVSASRGGRRFAALFFPTLLAVHVRRIRTQRTTPDERTPSAFAAICGHLRLLFACHHALFYAFRTLRVLRIAVLPYMTLPTHTSTHTVPAFATPALRNLYVRFARTPVC